MAIAGWVGWAMAVAALCVAIHFRKEARDWSALAATLMEQRDGTAALAASCVLNPGMGEGLKLSFLEAAIGRLGLCTSDSIVNWMERAAKDEGLVDELCKCAVATAAVVTAEEKQTWLSSGVIRAMQDFVYPESAKYRGTNV